MATPYALLTEFGDVLETESGLPIEIEYYEDFFGPSARFIIVEVEVYVPGVATVTLDEGHLSRPHLALAMEEDVVAASSKLLASDLGYRTLPSDPGGIVAYPSRVDQAFQIDNKLNLDPANSGVAASWGSVALADANSEYSQIASVWNSDGRPVRILTGLKTFDRTRQYHVDPAYGSLTLMWAGVATPWFMSDVALTIPLRDPTYWLERLYQTSLYGGTGGYDGTAQLTGHPIPRTRGGTATDPVRNITPTLVDPTNRIYQYSDGPGTVVALYEGGATVITRGADTTNLYAGSTPAGTFRTDNSRSLFQLGSVPVHTITADVTGAFGLAGVVTTFAAIARYLLTEDLLLPPANIDLTSFAAADAAFPYTSGIYFDSNSTPSGIDALTRVLSGAGGKLVTKRNGQLGMYMLRALPTPASPVASFDLSSLITLTPVALPATLDPPAFRWRSEYAHNYTVQTSDLNNASATPDQAQFVQATGKFATWSSTDVLIAWRRPNDPAPVTGPLLRLADAQTVVNALGALWGTRRRLYDAVVPAWPNLSRDIGDCISLSFPMDDLTNGRLGQIVGYTFRSTDSSLTLRVLV